MAQLDFYFDVDRRQRVRSSSDSSIVAMPPFALGDTYAIRIHPLQPTGQTIGTIYAPILTAGKTIEFAVGNLGGGGGGPYASQYVWTGNDANASDPFFYADVSFNTTEMTTLLTNEETARKYLQIILNDGTPKTIFQDQVTLTSAVIIGTPPSATPGQTWATMETVRALLQNITTKSVTIESPDGTHSRRLSEENDGTPLDTQSP